MDNGPEEIPRGTGRHYLYLTASMLQRPAEEQPHGAIYAQVKPSRFRRAGAVLPSVMSKESLETKVEQVEEGRQMDSQVGAVSPGSYGSPIIKYLPSSHSLLLQAAKNEGPQDVTYVQMYVQEDTQNGDSFFLSFPGREEP